MKIFKKILVILPFLIFILAIIIIINTAVSVRKQQVPLLFGYGFLTVTTSSMEPDYPIGTFLIIQRQRDYQEEDIVTFYYNIDTDVQKEPVTHKIITIEGNEITLQGINPDIDEDDVQVIEEEDIIGKVIYHNQKIGTFLASGFVQNKLYIYTVLIIGLLIFSGIQVANIIKYAKKAKDENTGKS
ncbi:MAG: S24/S26 family peptidase [Bacilli bacterium]|jgi:signal peptidase I|nr:S24/S26 family peptidase [Bacilli bacterium]MDY0064581.1 S24/S26 family peptidase [Bacilli bacterium]